MVCPCSKSGKWSKTFFFLLSVVKDINCSSVKLSKLGDLETFCVMPFCFLYHFEEKSNEINRNKMVPVQNGLN